MGRATVRDVMTEGVVTIGRDASLRQAAEAMLAHHVSGLPVTDGEQGLIGIVTESDLVRREAGRSPVRRPRLWTRRRGEGPARRVADVMTTPVETARTSEELRHAARRMVRLGVKRLPVVDEGRIVGILSRHDVLQVFDRTDAELKRAVERFLAENGFLPPEADLEVTVSDGVVTLTGWVYFEGEVGVVESLASSVDGVVGVTNHLTFHKTDPALTNYGFRSIG